MAFEDRDTVESPDARPSSVDLSTSPWLIQVFDRSPLPLLAMGILITLVHFLVTAALAQVMAPGLGTVYRVWQNGFGPVLALQILKSLQIGFLVTAAYYLVRGAVGDFQSLRPALSCDDIEFEHWLTRLRHVPRVPLYIVGALALWVGFSGPLNPSIWPAGRPPIGSARMSFAQIDVLLSIFFLTRVLALELIVATLFASVARRFARIELLDLERVAPFSRRALRGVLVLMLFITLAALQAIFDPNPGGAISMVIVISLMAVAFFLIPLIPLQRRIHAVKQGELARLRADIRRENEARIAGEEARTSLADLIMYKQEIERVSTWAFTTSTVFRFALYVSLGVGSWLGAAFVERWLGTLLGP